MKNKKGLLWMFIILVVILFLIVGVFLVVKNKHKDVEKEDVKTEEKEKKEEKKLDGKATPLLYKVTKEGSDNVIYLFGSIHVADDRAYPMRDEVMKAYEDSEYLAVEFDVISYMKDLGRQTEDMKALIYTNGDTVKDHMSEEIYNKMVEYLTDNKMYNKLYDMYKPALFYSLVTQVASEKSGLDSDKGIDMYFLNLAHKENKNILEVETSSYQYNLLASFSDRFYEAVIASMIFAEKTSIQEVKDLYEAWLIGDDKKIETNSESSEELDAEEFGDYSDVLSEIQTFNKKLVDDRNEAMLEKVDGYFKEDKKVFLVVGIAHIIGDKGIAKGLEDKGYDVQIVEYK